MMVNKLVKITIMITMVTMLCKWQVVALLPSLILKCLLWWRIWMIPIFAQIFVMYLPWDWKGWFLIFIWISSSTINIGHAAAARGIFGGSFFIWGFDGCEWITEFCIRTNKQLDFLYLLFFSSGLEVSF